MHCRKKDTHIWIHCSHTENISLCSYDRAHLGFLGQCHSTQLDTCNNKNKRKKGREGTEGGRKKKENTDAEMCRNTFLDLKWLVYS